MASEVIPFRIAVRTYENPYWKGKYKITITVHLFDRDIPTRLKWDLQDELSKLGFELKNALWYAYGKYCSVWEKNYWWIKFKSEEEAEEFAEREKERMRGRLMKVVSEFWGLMRYMPK